MKLRIAVTRKNALLYEGDYAATDAKTFGEVFANVWLKLVESKLVAGTSVGAVYETMRDRSFPDLDGVQIEISKISR